MWGTVPIRLGTKRKMFSLGVSGGSLVVVVVVTTEPFILLVRRGDLRVDMMVVVVSCIAWWRRRFGSWRVAFQEGMVCADAERLCEQSRRGAVVIVTGRSITVSVQ